MTLEHDKKQETEPRLPDINNPVDPAWEKIIVTNIPREVKDLVETWKGAIKAGKEIKSQR